MGRMRNPLHKVGIGPCVALATGFYQPLLRDEGLWIVGIQNVVKPVAISTPRHQSGVAQMLHLPMIALVIGLGGDEENLVSLHHLLVCVAFLANLRMELLSEFHRFGFIPL